VAHHLPPPKLSHSIVLVSTPHASQNLKFDCRSLVLNHLHAQCSIDEATMPNQISHSIVVALHSLSLAIISFQSVNKTNVQCGAVATFLTYRYALNQDNIRHGMATRLVFHSCKFWCYYQIYVKCEKGI
jgi:hypothetical protein